MCTEVLTEGPSVEHQTMTESASLRKARREPKPCDICGEDENLTLLGKRTFAQPTRGGLFEFAHDDMLCLSCGFVFSRSIPDDEFLNDYYRLAFKRESELVCIEPDFDPEARLRVIRRYAGAGDAVREIGASTGEFVERLNREGYAANGIDPLEKSSELVDQEGIFGSGSLEAATNQGCDAAVAYYVLEHITRPRSWLGEVRRFLKPEGILVIEVPDFSRCPEESLFPEHMVHFTPHHLRTLMESAGFEVLSAGEDNPSRHFGFVTVARKRGIVGAALPASGTQLSDRIDLAKKRYEEGIESRRRKEARYKSLVGYLQKLGATTGPGKSAIYFWPANDISGAIAQMFPDQSNVTVLDSSSSKIGRLYPGFENPIRYPSLERCDPSHRIFILCSPSWNSQIERQIRDMDLEDITILDAVDWSPPE